MSVATAADRPSGGGRATQLAALELILHGYRGGARSPRTDTHPSHPSVTGFFALGGDHTGGVEPPGPVDTLPVSTKALASALAELQEDPTARPEVNPAASSSLAAAGPAPSVPAGQSLTGPGGRLSEAAGPFAGLLPQGGLSSRRRRLN